VNSDLKYAFRGLRRSPGFACAAIVTLALGIAANGTVFTLVNGALLRDLPFDEPDRIVSLDVQDISNVQRTGDGLSYLELRDWQSGARTFEGIGACDEQTMIRRPCTNLEGGISGSEDRLYFGDSKLDEVSTENFL
jgi:putative ABC transport system permease protein